MEPKIKPRREFSPGTILKENGHIRILGFAKLPERNKQTLYELFDVFGLDAERSLLYDGQDVEFAEDNLPVADIGRALKTGRLDRWKIRQKFEREKIEFSMIFEKANKFANFLEKNVEQIYHALKNYETYNVVIDEIERSVEHLRNLDKNREYFEYKAPSIATFLPLNQPLYALVCFGIVPAMLCRSVHVRPPRFAHPTIQSLLHVLNLENWFENVYISYEDRSAFIDRTRRFVEGVIFVGSSKNIAKVHRIYPSDILFLANGSGHNPVIVGKHANLDNAIQSVMNVTLYNQGQDCCSPNTILVDAQLCALFVEKLLVRLKEIEHLVGSPEDKRNIVGPNTNKLHTLIIANAFIRDARYHIYGGDINPATGLIRPTLFLRPLSEGANYQEFFAPVFYIQPYAGPDELRKYFFSSEYRPNAMYITVYGEFELTLELIEAGLHAEENIIINSDLHKEEKGYKPYGGLGIDASCIYFHGKRKPGGILAQREIYTYLVRGTKW